jgi:hypothetical protein
MSESYNKYGKKYYESNKILFQVYRKEWALNNAQRMKELQAKASKKYYEKKKLQAQAQQQEYLEQQQPEYLEQQQQEISLHWAIASAKIN